MLNSLTWQTGFCKGVKVRIDRRNENMRIYHTLCIGICVYIYICSYIYIYTGRLEKIHETFVYWLWLSLWTTTNPNKNPSILKLPKFPDNFPPAAGSTPSLANFHSEKQLRFDKTRVFSCNSKTPEFSRRFCMQGVKNPLHSSAISIWGGVDLG